MSWMPRVEALAGAIYRAALCLSPRAFRRRWGAEMRATFDALCRDAAARGRCALAALLVRELGDLARAASAARRLADPDSLSFERREPVGTFWQDLRYAGRLLRRQPGFAAVAILTLALGIGATTAVFTVVNGVLLRPLPYPGADRIVELQTIAPSGRSWSLSPLDFTDYERQSTRLAHAAAFTRADVALTGTGEPERLTGEVVTSDFFDVMGVRPAIGRPFMVSGPADDKYAGTRARVVAAGVRVGPLHRRPHRHAGRHPVRRHGRHAARLRISRSQPAVAAARVHAASARGEPARRAMDPGHRSRESRRDDRGGERGSREHRDRAGGRASGEGREVPRAARSAARHRGRGRAVCADRAAGRGRYSCC